MSLREKGYEKKYINNVLHTTFNPYQPGVVRIHLVPPKFSWFKSIGSLVFLNGQYIIPVRTAWSILLSVFINETNKFDSKEITDAEVEVITNNTINEMKKIYGKRVKESIVKEDLNQLITTFTNIASGKAIEEKIPVVTIGDYAKYMRAPHRIDLLISAMSKENHWNCNQKCLHCYAAGQANANEKELSTKEWKDIIKKCKNIGIPQITFTGGEPTLRQDLVELVDSAKWFITRLNTNGVLLSQDLCEKLYNASLDSVQITLYSSNKEIHNKLVGADNFDKTVLGIKNALKAGLNVSINTPICSINENYKETLEFVNSLGIKYVSCSGLIQTGNAEKEESKTTGLSEEVLFEILKECKEFCDSNLMEISFTSPGWVKDEDLKTIGMDIPSCGACLSNMAIAPNGEVMPCQSWLSDNASLGNILKQSWKQIWNSKKCKGIRSNSSKINGKCPLKD